MSKNKDISTMFTREENKKNGRLGYYKKLDIISPAQYEHFCRKEVREDE